jgi:beta-N-acetylhexosaminidase
MPRRSPGLVLVLTVVATLLATPVSGQQPSPAALGSTDGDRVSEIIEGMSLRQKVGQLFMSRAYGFRADDPKPGARRSNRAHLGVDDAAELVSRYHVGSIVYFGYAGNLERPTQVARMSNGIQRAAHDAGAPPVLISTDQEHGIIERLGPPATRFPGSMALGATRSTELAREAARVTGSDLRAVGIQQDLAPVADVNANPANPVIGVRSFGSRPRLVASMTEAQVRGFQEDAGVAATVKHFPGHGDTNIDSHTALPTIRHDAATWRRVDAPSFTAAIEAGVDVVMTAHVAVPALDPSRRPATLSHPILTGVLRDELGFEGVIMTDSLTMAALRDAYGDRRIPVLALKAGADILADPPDLPVAYRAVVDAVESGELSEQRLETSVERILRLKERLGLLDEPMVDVAAVADALGTDADEAVAQAVGDASVTVLRDRKSWLPLPPRWTVLVSGWAHDGARHLQRELRQSGRRVEELWTGPNPTRKQIAAAVRRSKDHDVTIVVTASLGANPAQRTLIGRLTDAGRRVIVVYANSPYDAAWFPSAWAQVATYSAAPVSMRGLARVVNGDVVPRGTLPVRIPRPGRPGATLLPFGQGETW